MGPSHLAMGALRGERVPCDRLTIGRFIVAGLGLGLGLVEPVRRRAARRHKALTC
jgi:hypothetical protein